MIVSTVAALDAAINNGVAQITLGANANFGNYTIANVAGLTLKAEDADNPPVFNFLKIKSVSDLTLDGISFDIPETTSASDVMLSTQELVKIENSDAVTVKNSKFTGATTQNATKADDAANGFDNDGQAAGHSLSAANTTNLTVETSTFEGLRKGVKVDSSAATTADGSPSKLTIQFNEFVKLSEDGITLWDIDGAQINNNYFHEFERNWDSSGHSDMIQVIHKNGDTVKSSSNITVSENVIDDGANYTGPITETVTDPNTSGATMTVAKKVVFTQGIKIDKVEHVGIVIEDNIIHNSHKIGIYLQGDATSSVNNNYIYVNTVGQPSQEQADAFRKLKIDIHNSGNGTPREYSQPDIAKEFKPTIWDVGSNAVIGTNMIVDTPIDFSDPAHPFQLALAKFTAGPDGDTDPGVNEIVGTNGSDRLAGTAEADVIDALNANDYVRGLTGDDSILGGFGNDSLYGDSGDDTVSGGGGNDILVGAAGNDKLDGGSANDKLYGGGGNDVLIGGGGADSVNGQGGNDRVFGGGGNDTVNGGSGSDTIDGGGASDIIQGQSGDDVIRGGRGNDTVSGNGGVDTFVFHAGDYRMNITDFNAAAGETVDLQGIDPAQFGSWTIVDGDGVAYVDFSSTTTDRIYFNGIDGSAIEADWFV